MENCLGGLCSRVCVLLPQSQTLFIESCKSQLICKSISVVHVYQLDCSSFVQITDLILILQLADGRAHFYACLEGGSTTKPSCSICKIFCCVCKGAPSFQMQVYG